MKIHPTTSNVQRLQIHVNIKMSALQKKVLQSGLPPRPSMSVGRGSINARKKKDYSAIHWSNHFNYRHYVTLDNGDKFCVYEGGVNSKSEVSKNEVNMSLPVLVLLHGGK